MIITEKEERRNILAENIPQLKVKDHEDEMLCSKLLENEKNAFNLSSCFPLFCESFFILFYAAHCSLFIVPRCSSSSLFLPPANGLAKVMFLVVSVCPQGRRSCTSPALPCPAPNIFKPVQPHYTALPLPTQGMFRLVHYVAYTISKRTVGIFLECLLVSLIFRQYSTNKIFRKSRLLPFKIYLKFKCNTD